VVDVSLLLRGGNSRDLPDWVCKGRTKVVDVSLLLRGGNSRDLPD